MALKKMGSLKEKLEEKAILERAIIKVEDKIDEIVGDKKVKIIKKKSK